MVSLSFSNNIIRPTNTRFIFFHLWHAFGALWSFLWTLHYESCGYGVIFQRGGELQNLDICNSLAFILSDVLDSELF